MAGVKGKSGKTFRARTDKELAEMRSDNLLQRERRAGVAPEFKEYDAEFWKLPTVVKINPHSLEFWAEYVIPAVVFGTVFDHQKAECVLAAVAWGGVMRTLSDDRSPDPATLKQLGMQLQSLGFTADGHAKTLQAIANRDAQKTANEPKTPRQMHEDAVFSHKFN